MSALPAPSAATAPRLGLRAKVGFGLGEVGGSITVTINGFFLYAFLLDVAGLRPAAVGLIFLIAQLWDAFIHPYIGYLSDRTRSRWGRKRVWMLFGALPFGLAYLLNWTVPPLAGGALVAYYLLVALLLKTANSAVSTPYSALTADMTGDYQERVQLNTYRFIFSLAGSLLAVVLHPVLVGLGGADARAGHLISAGVFAGFIVLTVLASFRTTFETGGAAPAPRLNLGRELRVALGNRPFMLATGIFLSSWVVVLLVQNNLQLFMRYWAEVEPHFTGVILVFQVSAMLFIGVWGWASRRLDKKTVYTLGVLLWAAGLAALYVAPRGVPWPYYLIAFVIGAGAAVAYLVPWSMLPDTVDFDELQTGERREGVYYGLFVFLQQVGLSIGLAASGFLLDAAGYVNAAAGRGAAQPEAVQDTLRILVSLVPAAILLLSLPLAARYPITRERFAAIRAELDARR